VCAAQVPLLGEEARATYDRLTEKSASLPGREEAECRIKMWYSRRHEGYDLTRSDVLTIANAPGMGKTTLLLCLTTVLEGLVSETSEQRPVVVAEARGGRVDLQRRNVQAHPAQIALAGCQPSQKAREVRCVADALWRFAVHGVQRRQNMA